MVAGYEPTVMSSLFGVVLYFLFGLVGVWVLGLILNGRWCK